MGITMNHNEMQAKLENQEPQMGQPQLSTRPELMQQLPQDSTEQAMNYGNPMLPSSQGGAGEMQPEPEPTQVIGTVVTEYMDYAVGIKNNPQLNEQVRSQIMLQMAQAINYLVPLLQNDKEQELQLKQQEMQMTMALKQQEHGMNMEMKQAELGFKQQEMQMKLQQSNDQHQQSMKHKEEQHQHNIVQSHNSHEQKMEQGKQAAQLKQSQKDSSKQGN